MKQQDHEPGQHTARGAGTTRWQAAHACRLAVHLAVPELKSSPLLWHRTTELPWASSLPETEEARGKLPPVVFSCNCVHGLERQMHFWGLAPVGCELERCAGAPCHSRAISWQPVWNHTLLLQPDNLLSGKTWSRWNRYPEERRNN